MPLYEYQCTKCGHRFERIRKFSDPAVETCPVCGGKVEKLLSAPAFTFKGTGFYITDYKKESKESRESKESKESGTSKESGESKTSGGAEKSAKPASAKADSAADSSKTSPSSPAKPAKSE